MLMVVAFVALSGVRCGSGTEHGGCCDGNGHDA
jgi:hypothetical protein